MEIFLIVPVSQPYSLRVVAEADESSPCEEPADSLHAKSQHPSAFQVCRGPRYRRDVPSCRGLGWFWLTPFLFLLKSLFFCLKTTYYKAMKRGSRGNFQKGSEIDIK